jgi:AraC family transcriptional regulator
MSLTLFPASHAHTNYWGESGGRVLHVEFGRPWLERMRERPSVLARPGDFDRGPPIWLARRLADESRRHDSARALAIEGLVLELLAECTRADERAPSRRPPRWLSGVCALLHDRFAETLALVDIAASAGVSADHLGRVFRKHVGCSIGSYVRRVRIEYACEQLISADISLAEIASAAGFTDQSHFTRVFRELTGLTPAAFRARRSDAKAPRFRAIPQR